MYPGKIVQSEFRCNYFIITVRTNIHDLSTKHWYYTLRAKNIYKHLIYFLILNFLMDILQNYSRL